MKRADRLVALATHPVQYHAPVYREVERLGLPVTALYGSDFSVAGYRDAEFGVDLAWDVDLTGGYDTRFLARMGQGGASGPEGVRGAGLLAALRDAAPTAVLLTGYGLPFHRVAWAAAWRTRRPLLFRGETTDHAGVRSRVRHTVRDAVLRLGYRSLAQALYIGQRSRAHFERLGVGPARQTFAPYCVDIAPFQTNETARAALRGPTRAALGIPPDHVVLLYSGKLSERKGVDLLPAALSALPAATRERLTLLLLGDGALRAPVEVAAQAAGVNVRAAGFQPQKNLSAYYHASDVLVLPSRRGETWGLVVNEALEHGLPCLVSDEVGCTPDLVISGETGEAVSSDSAPALSQGLATILAWHRNEEAQRAHCRHHVAGYSVAAAAKGVIRAYERGVRGRS